MREYCGSCHCGNITYAMQWPQHNAPALRRCLCTFCTKHGAVYAAHPSASIHISIARTDDIIPYQFAMRSSTFVICKTCGALTFVASAIEGHNYAVVNANTFAQPLSNPKIVSHNFDGETIEERLRRRQANWIGDVSFIDDDLCGLFPQNIPPSH